MTMNRRDLLRGLAAAFVKAGLPAQAHAAELPTEEVQKRLAALFRYPTDLVQTLQVENRPVYDGTPPTHKETWTFHGVSQSNPNIVLQTQVIEPSIGSIRTENLAKLFGWLPIHGMTSDGIADLSRAMLNVLTSPIGKHFTAEATRKENNTSTPHPYSHDFVRLPDSAVTINGESIPVCRISRTEIMWKNGSRYVYVDEANLRINADGTFGELVARYDRTSEEMRVTADAYRDTIVVKSEIRPLASTNIKLGTTVERPPLVPAPVSSLSDAISRPTHGAAYPYPTYIPPN